MAFKVAARMILELGAELISSDGIALYELIKNSYDAGSRRVKIAFISVIKNSRVRDLIQKLDDAEHQGLGNIYLSRVKREIAASVDETASPELVEELIQCIEQANSFSELRNSLVSAANRLNSIEIVDTGDGMSLLELKDKFLTIGTRSRLEGSAKKKFVGGKGIGRLSSMRLGDMLTVITSRAGELHENVLEIDWSQFSHTSDQTIEEIKVVAKKGKLKSDPTSKGTRLIIRSLKSDWDYLRLERLSTNQFDRLFDPFSGVARYPLIISINSKKVKIPGFDETILAEAQAEVTIDYLADVGGQSRLTLKIDYHAQARTKVEVWDEVDLLGLTSQEDVSVHAFKTLGDFNAKFYWFNRQKLRAIDGWGDRNKVRDEVNHWANGLLMYRDGFRVYPYGNPDDDWLGLDAKAFGSAGYKVNRKQIIGAVNITASSNPFLIDQTNREGLRATEEKAVLVLLLRDAISEKFKLFLNDVEKEIKKAKRMTAAQGEDFLKKINNDVGHAFQALNKVVLRENKSDVELIRESFFALQDRFNLACESITTAERDQRDLVHLAGIGLLIEIVSHELGRVVRRTLDLISEIDRDEVSHGVGLTLDSVGSQMLVIRKRLDLMDPLSPSARQKKEKFDLVSLVRDIIESHSEQFKRARIKCTVSVVSKRRQEQIQVRAVKGMIVQILENLIDNSVFWLGQSLRADPSYDAKITVEIDGDSNQLRIQDSGPGIPVSRSEEVFKPFVTFKPPGLGKGLGLYISKEVARYHGANLYLAAEDVINDRLHTFVLDIDELK